MPRDRVAPDHSVVPMAPDVSVAANDLTARPGLSLIAVLRNEIYMLPTFLEAYRKLGVARFILLDDRSDDGSADYLAQQSDVMLLTSTRRYGDRPDEAELPPALRGKGDLRMIHLWRTALMNRFCHDRWAVQCDLDEIACLPKGTDLNTLTQAADQKGENGIWGGMIDLYPESIDDLAPGTATAGDPRAGTWYFDGARHFTLRKGAPPLHRYVGVRYRLDTHYGLKPKISALRALKLKWRGRYKAPSGRLVKPLLQRWSRGNFYLSSHVTTLSLGHHQLIPLMHYRYTPAIYGKIDWAIPSGGYSKGNSDYQRFDALLSRMAADHARFTCPLSRRFTGFDDLAATGNAIGLN